jgi:hypothetical protein
MALLTVYELGQTGFDIEDNMVAAGASGDQYPNDERTFLVVKNVNVAARTITISATRSTADKFGFGTLDVDDISQAIAQNEVRVVRVPVASHGDAAGRVTVTYSDNTDVTVKAIRMARH